MRLRISGIDGFIDIRPSYVTTIEILNPEYAGRVVFSLCSGLGEESLEPYILCDDSNKIISSSKNMKVITSVFNLPFEDHTMMSSVLSKVSSLISENEASRRQSDVLGYALQENLNQISLQMLSDYGFTEKWDVVKFLKAFGFKAELNESDTLFDRMEKFLRLVYDVSYEKVLVIVGLKQYFNVKQLNEIFCLIRDLKISLLAIETSISEFKFENEIKISIDQGFLQI